MAQASILEVTSDHACPVCGERAGVAPFCVVDGYEILICHACGAEHVFPVPDDRELKAYYDRREYFEGGEKGGYADYDAQTMPSVDQLKPVLDEFGGREGLSVLDVGCGYGKHLSLAADRGWKCFGVEISDHARAIAKSRLGHNAHIVGSVADLVPHQFDLILMLDVIEHLPSPYTLFYSLFAIGAIVSRTRVIIATPNAGGYEARNEPASWAYRHPPSHLVLYSANALQRLLRRLRFSTVDIRGLHPMHAEVCQQAPFSDFRGLLATASGSDFTEFMRERYVPGTWSKIAEYEHKPRYALAKTLAAKKRVLDFGCGTGYGSAMLATVAAEVIGLDIDQGAIDWARQTHLHPRLHYECCDDLGASLPAGGFDLVTCFEMIEHVDHLTQMATIASIARVLRSDGMLLISTPNPAISKLYGENPYHVREMTLSEFLELLGDHFAHVRILEQRVRTCISFTGDTSGTRLRHEPLQFSDRTSEPAAFLAICSRCPIAGLPPVAYFDEEADVIRDYMARENALNSARYEAYRLGEQIHAAERERAEIPGRLAALTKTIDEQIREIGRLNEAHRTQAQALLVQGEEVHRLNSFVVAKDQALATQAREIGRLNEAHRAQEQANDHALRMHAAEIRRSNEALERMNLALADKDQVMVTQAAEIHRLNLAIAEKERVSAERIRQLTAGADVQRLALIESTKRAHMLSAKLTDNERELASWRQTSWYKLGQAWDEEGWSLNRMGRVAYHLLRGVTPGTLKRPVRPLVARLKRRYQRHRAAEEIAPPALTPPDDGRSGRPRVLHVIANFMLGGSSRLVADLIEGLGDAYEQKVVTSFLPSPRAYDGIDATEFRSPQSPEDVLPFLREYRPSLVHVHYWGDCDFWWYDIFFRAVQTLGCRVIENVNTPVHPYRAEFVDRYVYVSAFVRSTFGDEDGFRNLTIHPGSDFSLFAQSSNRQLPRDCLGMVYRLESDKLNERSIDAFIKVAQRRPQTKVIIVGGGTLLDVYRRAVNEAGVERNFVFTGYVDYSKLPELYEQMTIFVAPVWKESFGQVSSFAMSMGIPVTGYGVGGLLEIVDDASLLAEAGDSDQLAALAMQLLDDPERCRRIGARNRDRALALFSLEAMLDAYRRVYGELLEVPG